MKSPETYGEFAAMWKTFNAREREQFGGAALDVRVQLLIEGEGGPDGLPVAFETPLHWVSIKMINAGLSAINADLESKRGTVCPQCKEPTFDGQHCEQCINGGIGR